MEFIENLWENIKNIPTFIRNLWKYRFILWNDRSFEYEYLIDLIQFKLLDLEQYLTTVKEEDSIKYIRLSRKLIDILNKGKYINDVIGSYNMDFKKDDKGNLLLNIENEDQYVIDMEEAKEKTAKAEKLLFRIVSEKLKTWWY